MDMQEHESVGYVACKFLCLLFFSGRISLILHDELLMNLYLILCVMLIDMPECNIMSKEIKQLPRFNNWVCRHISIINNKVE